jgi:hypothetical protein
MARDSAEHSNKPSLGSQRTGSGEDDPTTKHARAPQSGNQRGVREIERTCQATAAIVSAAIASKLAK